MIYFDSAATTPMDPQVIEVVENSMRRDLANSGAVYRIGLDAKKRIEKAEQDIADSLNVPSNRPSFWNSNKLKGSLPNCEK